MTLKERIIIASHYHQYCLNRVNGDPVGGYEDINQLFRDLKKLDPKLKEMLETEFDSVFSEDEEDVNFK